MRERNFRIHFQKLNLLKSFAFFISILLSQSCETPKGGASSVVDPMRCSSLANFQDQEGQNVLNAACGGPLSANQSRVPEVGNIVTASTRGEAITAPCHECEDRQRDRTPSNPNGRATKYQAEDVPPNSACIIPGMSAKAKRNCAQILAKDLVPKNAFMFTLDGLKRNATGFKTDKCFESYKGSSGVSLASRVRDNHHSMQGGNSPSAVRASIAKNGIPNKCTMVINNHDEKLNNDCRVQMYYINLCGDDGPEVTKTYSNQGVGSCRQGSGNSFRNDTGLKTTVLGFGVTGGGSTFNFKGRSAYKATPVYGLQNTNNGSGADLKYFHSSPHKSSFGCPTVNKDYNYIIEEMTKNGPSVIVAYKEGQMEDFKSCE